MIRSLNYFLLFFLLITSSALMAEGPPWKIYSNIHTTEKDIGVAIDQGEATTQQDPRKCFTINESYKITELNEYDYSAFFKLSSPLVNPFPDEELQSFENLNKTVNLNTKDNINVNYRNCSQEEEGGPSCKEATVIVKNFKININIIKQCKYGCLITAAKTIHNTLWLAFGVLGEYNWYGRGVQALDLATGKLKFESPIPYLATDFVLNPKKEKIIISTDNGIHEINATSFKVITSFSIIRDFNSSTGKVESMLVKELKKDNHLAVLAQKLGFENDRKFYDAVFESLKNPLVVNAYDIYSLLENVNLSVQLSPFVLNGLKSKDLLIKILSASLVNYISNKEIANVVYSEIINYPKDKSAYNQVVLEPLDPFISAYKGLQCKTDFYSSEQVKLMVSLLSKYNYNHYFFTKNVGFACR